MADLNKGRVVEPEIYRNTPFEYDVTADPAQHSISASEIVVQPKGFWSAKIAKQQRIPALPRWMTAPQAK